MYEPFYSEMINVRDAHHVPGTIHAVDTYLGRYFRRYLLQKVCSVFDIDGLPDSWKEQNVDEYVKYCLFGWGSVAVFNTDKFGVIPQACGYYGYNVFYRPTHAVISNPLFDKTYRLEINKQCGIIRLAPDWCGIADLIGHYADLAALVVSAIVSNLYNARLAYVFTADNQAMSESFKKMYDKITEGNPAVVADRKLFGEDGTPRWSAFQQNLKQVYLVDVLQAAEQAIEVDFYTQIGIPNVNYEKKERLLVSEISSNRFATQCLSDLWLRTLNATSEKVNELFGLSLKFDYTKALKEQIEMETDMQKMQLEGGNEQGPNAGFSGRSNKQARGE